jgi:nitrogen fixation/metabolism regulation signal transduction histidine kinase
VGVFELRRVAAIILLFLGVGLSIHLLLEPLRHADQPAAIKAVTLGIGLVLAVLGLTGGYLIARIPKERVRGLVEHLDHMVRRHAFGLVPAAGEAGSLGELGQAVNRYLVFVKDEVERSDILAKERQIQMKVLEAEKRHIEAVIHAISDGVIVTDAFGDLMLANAAAEAWMLP